MTECYVQGVSVFGPGLRLWAEARSVLRGEASLSMQNEPPPPSALLAPNERRRAGLPARLALAVSEEAVRMAGFPLDAVGAVFASANGEGTILHGLLETLAGPDRLLSPTMFHNSVHNAVAGYWSIGSGSAQPVTCLGCLDGSFAAGLLKAATEAAAERRPTLLCVYDAPMPAPLAPCRPTAFPFAVAFVLTTERTPSSLAALDIGYRAGAGAEPDDLPEDAGLRAMVSGNAAARALRLLELLARHRTGRCGAALLDGRVNVTVHP